MTLRARILTVVVTALLVSPLTPGPASATYEPGEPELSWNHQLDEGYDEHLTAVATAGGVVWSVGHTNTVNDGRAHAVVIRTDADGRLLGQLDEGSPAGSSATGVVAGAFGAVVVGTTGGTFPGTDADPPIWVEQGWVQLLGADGSIRWTTQFDGDYHSLVNGVAVLGNTVYVVGYSYPTGQDPEFMIRSFSLVTGAPISTRDFGTTGYDVLSGVTAVDGQVVVAGRSTGEVAAGQQRGGYDVVVASLDPVDLSTVWATQTGTEGNDGAAALTARDGVVYWVGGLGNVDNGDEFSAAKGGVGAVRADGTPLWQHRLGPGSAYVRAVMATSEGIVVAGNVAKGELGAETASFGDEDAFLQGRAFSGETLWTEVYGGHSYDYFDGLAAVGDRLLTVGANYEGMFGEDHPAGAMVVAALDVPPLLRPDVSVRPRATTAFVGDNRYLAGRAVRVTVRRGGTTTARVRLEDDGFLRDQLVLRGCRGSRHLRVSYLRGGHDVSAAVRRGTFRTQRLAASTGQGITLRVTADARAGAARSCVLTTRSSVRSRAADRIRLRIVVRD